MTCGLTTVLTQWQVFAIVFGGGMQAGNWTGGFSTIGVCMGGALIGGNGQGLGPQFCNIIGNTGAQVCVEGWQTGWQAGWQGWQADWHVHEHA